MKYVKLLIILTIIFFLSFCTISKLVTSGIKPNQITDLQYFEPFSYITKIAYRNVIQDDFKMSLTSKNLIVKVINNYKGQLHITGEIEITNSIVEIKVENEIKQLISAANRYKDISKIKITPTIDSLLKQNGKRFGLIIVGTGFQRTEENYDEEEAIGAGMAILSLGLIYNVPIEGNSKIYAMIVDAKDKNLAFFRKSFLKDSPIDEDVLKKQIQKIFKRYFW
jgi:hypothetical protein